VQRGAFGAQGQTMIDPEGLGKTFITGQSAFLSWVSDPPRKRKKKETQKKNGKKIEVAVV